MEGLKTVYDLLIGAGVRGELWLDGSFLTEKVNPGDVDVLLRLQGEDCEEMTDDQRKAVCLLKDGNTKAELGVHGFVLFQYRPEHPHYWVGEYMYAYWMKQWGFARNEDQKGIAALSLVGGQ
jgi:hypothetical protein